ncbi:MAG: hypothetical protein ACRDZU_00945 [Acidimicrobiales bacterium]
MTSDLRSARRTLTSLLCVSALVLGAAACSDDEPTTADEPSSTTTTSTSVPTTVPPDPLAVNSYLSTDGSRPALLPSCYGLFGACLGSPIDQLTAVLGPEETRSGDAQGVQLVWTLENQMILTVVHDAVGSIKSFGARSAPPSPGSRLGLPGGLVFGMATGGDVQAIYGEHGFGDQACENFYNGNTFYCVYHYDLVDGTVHIDFGLSQEGTDIPVEQRSRMVVDYVYIAVPFWAQPEGE